MMGLDISSSGAKLVELGMDGSGSYVLERLASEPASPPPEAVMETLFGVQKGERSKSTRSKRGLFELAQGGVVFLDDIEELSLEAQSRVLQVIQEGAVARIGSDAPVAVDARVLAASTASLEDAMAQGDFLEDLFYGLGVFPLSSRGAEPMRRLRGLRWLGSSPDLREEIHLVVPHRGRDHPAVLRIMAAAQMAPAA